SGGSVSRSSLSRSTPTWRSAAGRRSRENPLSFNRTADRLRRRLPKGGPRRDLTALRRDPKRHRRNPAHAKEDEMRGRRPKPTRLKALTGNPGKRPLNSAELNPEPAVPECPAELGPVARREWDRLVGELAALRLLTNLDRAALAAYCGAHSLSAQAVEAIHKHRTMIKSPTRYPTPT